MLITSFRKTLLIKENIQSTFQSVHIRSYIFQIICIRYIRMLYIDFALQKDYPFFIQKLTQELCIHDIFCIRCSMHNRSSGSELGRGLRSSEKILEKVNYFFPPSKISFFVMNNFFHPSLQSLSKLPLCTTNHIPDYAPYNVSKSFFLYKSHESAYPFYFQRTGKGKEHVCLLK